MSKAIVALGVVAGLGVAAMPLSSYAASSQSKQAQIKVEVGGSISLALENATGETNFDTTTNTLDLGSVNMNAAPATGKIAAKVSSNDPIGYTLSIRALNSGEMIGDAGKNIPNADATQGSAGWGYNTDGGTTFTKLPTVDTAIIGDTDNGQSAANTTKEEGAQDSDPATDTTVITFGVSADNTIPEGTYTGTVVLTAAVK